MRKLVLFASLFFSSLCFADKKVSGNYLDDDMIKQKFQQLHSIIADFEELKIKTAQRHEEFIDALRHDHMEQLARLQDEIRKAELKGYKRGVDVMLETYRKSNQTSDNIPSIAEKLKLI